MAERDAIPNAPSTEARPPWLPSNVDADQYDQQMHAFGKQFKRLPMRDIEKIGVDNVIGPLDVRLDCGLETLILLSDCSVVESQAVSSSSSENAPAIPLGSLLWEKIRLYMQTFDPIAVRYAGEFWRKLIELVHQSATRARAPAAAIPIIRDAMMRLDPTLGTFTSNHNLLLQLCLESGQYEEALPVLDAYIHSFPSDSNHGFDGGLPCSNFLESSGYMTIKSGLTDKIHEDDVQLYFLMGGMLYLGMGPSKYDDALMFFEALISMPAHNVASGLMLEAYRKILLLHLLRHGKALPQPQHANHYAIRVLKSAAKPYEALQKAYLAGDPSALREEINAGMEIWADDGNLSLALALVASIPRFHIISLSQRYTSIPLSTVAEHPSVQLSLDDVRNHVTALLSAGALPRGSTLAMKDGIGPVLRFAPSVKESLAAVAAADGDGEDGEDGDDDDEEADWGAGRPEAARRARAAADAEERRLTAVLSAQAARVARAAAWARLASERALTSREFAVAMKRAVAAAEAEAANAAALAERAAATAAAAAAQGGGGGAGASGVSAVAAHMDDAMALDDDEDEGLGDVGRGGGGDVDEEDMMHDE